MPKLIIEVKTVDQARVLAQWYEGQGEQSAEIWFDEKKVETPVSNVRHPGGCIQIDEAAETVTLYCV